MSKNENKIIFKIITLGESGVGKTSIIRRYIYINTMMIVYQQLD